MQYSPNATTTPKLDKRGITRMQSIADTFLYTSRAVDPKRIVSLNEIGANQASPTTNTVNKKQLLMYYSATQPDAVVRFHASKMCLHIDSDNAYLVQPKPRSRVAGH